MCVRFHPDLLPKSAREALLGAMSDEGMTRQDFIHTVEEHRQLLPDFIQRAVAELLKIKANRFDSLSGVEAATPWRGGLERKATTVKRSS